MALLAIASIVLPVFESTGHTSPSVEVATNVIWIILLLVFAFWLALTSNRRRVFVATWLTIVSPIVPALSLLRVATILRAWFGAFGWPGSSPG